MPGTSSVGVRVEGVAVIAAREAVRGLVFIWVVVMLVEIVGVIWARVQAVVSLVKV